LQFQRRALAPGGIPGRRAPSDLQAIDSDHYGLPASGTGDDVIKQVGDAISSWLATHE